MAAIQHPSYGIIAYISLLLNLDLSQLQVIRACSFAVQLLIIVIVIKIFVDDLLVTGNSIAEIEALRERMNKRFLLTDQGIL